MNNTCIRVYADTAQISQCKENLTTVENSVSCVAKVLNLAGNEVRLKILYLLNQESKMCPCDLSDILGMTVPAISQHFKKLKDAGLVSTDKAGQTVFYSLRSEHVAILHPIFQLLIPKKPLAL